MAAPIISKDPLYQMLYNENVAAFNAAREQGQDAKLRGCVFRGLDLRGLNAAGLDFTDAYFKGADLRGVDFRGAKLEGASFGDAQIKGCYFPAEIEAYEIVMSVVHGTRIRYRP